MAEGVKGIFFVVSLAYLLSKNKLSFPLRRWLYGLKAPAATFIYSLLTCMYCVSFWVAMIYFRDVVMAFSVAYVAYLVEMITGLFDGY